VIVVDAGVALDALLSSDGMATLAPHEPVSPPVLWSEVTASLREVVWRRLLSKEAALEGLTRLGKGTIKRNSPKELHVEAWRVAEELGWARTYDAEYVALAKLLECRLVTRDARLQRAASRLVDVIGPTEL
jgi:predicted nucleic acid-binding protein